MALSLVSFSIDDPSFNIARSSNLHAKPQNFVGIVGAYAADGFFQIFGYSSFLIPIFLGVYAFYWLASWPVRAVVARLTGAMLLIFTLSAIMSWSPSFPRVSGQLPAGGLIGRVIEDNLEALVNPAGAAILLIAAFLASLFLTTTFSFEWAMSVLKPRFAFISAWAERYAAWKEERKLADARRKAEQRKAPRKQMIAQTKERIAVAEREPEIAEVAPQELPRVLKPASIIAPTQLPSSPRAATAMAKATTKPGDTTLAQLPSTTLLNIAIALAPINEDELRQRALSVESKCREFEVDGTVQHIHPDPWSRRLSSSPNQASSIPRLPGSAMISASPSKPNPCASIACRGNPPSASKCPTTSARPSCCANCWNRPSTSTRTTNCR
jgi:S-DNA-T family DNA segregation ATPase FtsK/SpoIIIE